MDSEVRVTKILAVLSQGKLAMQKDEEGADDLDFDAE
jgi:hypothetical protein